LKQSQRYSPQQNKNNRRTRKPAQPNKILNRPRMSLAPREVQAQLTKRSKIRVKKEAWRLPIATQGCTFETEFGSTHTDNSSDLLGKGDELTEQNDLPPFSVDRRLQRNQRPISQ